MSQISRESISNQEYIPDFDSAVDLSAYESLTIQAPTASDQLPHVFAAVRLANSNNTAYHNE